MKRAAVIIAVKKTGDPRLQELQAAASSAEKLVTWANAHDFANVELLTDENGPLGVKAIKDTIKAIVDGGTTEQLFVYFSGHGVNLNRNEYWLLSGYPEDTQECINVTGSAELARYCGIPHVIFISDACRTAPAGVQAPAGAGSHIFPHKPVHGAENSVDMFFACGLGDPALEVPGRDMQYKAIYTEAIVEGLQCSVPDCLETAQVRGKHLNLVRAWPLKRYLQKAVPKRLLQAAIPVTYRQVPDARIGSPPEAWLAAKELEAPPPGAPAPTPSSLPKVVPSHPISPLLPSELNVDQGLKAFPFPGFAGPNDDLLERSPDVEPGDDRYERILGPAVTLETELLLAVRREASTLSESFGRTHFENGCGFKVQGADILESFHPSGNTGLDGPDSAWVNPTGPTNVVLRFANNTGVILPAIPSFIAGLTFEDGNLVNVVYEPSDNSDRWQDYHWEIQRLRALRGQIAAATRLGIFQPVGEGVAQLAREMQSAKKLDPTMALYAAYAYYSVQQTRRVAEMEKFLARDLKFRFFDLALLAGTLHEKMESPILPSTPLLAQGWALLSAREVELPASLKDLPRCLTPSLWSTFNLEGVQLLKTALTCGEISP